MYSVFSKKLFEFRKIVEGTQTEDVNWKLSDTIDIINNNLSYTTALITVNSNVLENDVEHVIGLIHSNKELSDVIYWINNKILKVIKVISLPTLYVRLRIATSMLNKINIDPLVSIIIHDNFVTNLKGLYFDLKTEELPFLGRKPNEIGILTAH